MFEAFEAEYNVVDLPSNALLDAVVVPTTCAGASDGAVDLLVDATGFDLTYAWSPLAGNGSVWTSRRQLRCRSRARLVHRDVRIRGGGADMLMVGLLDSVQTTRGYALGSMEVMAFGGTPAVYSWEDGTEGSVYADMAEGTHGLILDAMGCVYETSFDMACLSPCRCSPTNSSPRTTTS